MRSSNTEDQDPASAFLCGVLAALRARRKSLKHRLKSLALEIHATPGTEECLAIHVETMAARPTRMNVLTYADGFVSVTASRPGPSRRGGWELNLSWSGQADTASPAAIQEAMERSLDLLYAEAKESDVAPRFASCWASIASTRAAV
jgi:hypothetical protein